MKPSDPTPLSAEDLYARPDRKGYELVRGALRVREPRGGVHGGLAALLAARLVSHVEEHRLGTVLVESGYVLRRKPDTVRGPDISFVSATRMSRQEIPVAFIPGPPDLVIEILSPDDRPKEVAERVRDYREGGVRLVWIVDPMKRLMVIHRPDRPEETVPSDQPVDGEDVVPGFRFTLEELLGDR